jgi:hypothetical protein
VWTNTVSEELEMVRGRQLVHIVDLGHGGVGKVGTGQESQENGLVLICRVLHSCYTVVTLLLHCCHIVVSLLFV